MIIFILKIRSVQKGLNLFTAVYCLLFFTSSAYVMMLLNVWILVPESGYFIGGDLTWKYLTKFYVSSLDTLFEFVKRNLPTLPG